MVPLDFNRWLVRIADSGLLEFHNLERGTFYSKSLCIESHANIRFPYSLTIQAVDNLKDRHFIPLRSKDVEEILGELVKLEGFIKLVALTYETSGPPLSDR